MDGKDILGAEEAVRQEALVVHAGSFEGAVSRWLAQAAVAYRVLARENQRLSEAAQQASKAMASEVATRKFAEEALQTSLRRLELAYTQANYYTGELRKEILTRKKAEEALARSEELRRFQAAQEAKERERKRLAEELHDVTLAELASVILELGLLAKQIKQTSPKAESEVNELRQRVRGTEKQLRQIVLGIFPSVLTNLGLVPAVRSYLEDLASRPIQNPTALNVEIIASGLTNGRLPEDVEIAVYRVVQQSVTNAIQHAQAKHLKIELDWGESQMRLAVTDDGVGFDPARTTETPASGHFGLVNLKDRIESLGGELRIESKRLEGTRVVATVQTPLRPPATGEVQRSSFTLNNADAGRTDGSAPTQERPQDG